MILKEMEYVAEFKQPELLAFGFHKHRRYWVVSRGPHACCYIEILKKDCYYGRSAFSSDIHLDVPGGLTYSGTRAPDDSNVYWVLGWDYAHYNDYTSTFVLHNKSFLRNGTVEQMEKDCIDAINQIDPIIWK